MTLPQRSKLRDFLLDLAEETRQAARRALQEKAPSRIVRTGASGSPTSALDAAAEQVLIDRLPEAPVPLNLLSEEVGFIDHGAHHTLVADPVDGTRNALRGIPFYCVSLAVGTRDLRSVELGLVHSIPHEELYLAEKGRGAMLNGDPIRVRKMNAHEVVFGAALDYERGLKLPGQAHLHFRDLGSAALEMCLVAQGGLDGFLSTKPYLRVIDIAAASLIVEEAGGRVLNLKKKPLNAPFDVQNRIAMVALGDAAAWSVLE